MLVSHRNRKRIACIALIFSLSVVLIICMSPAFPAGSVYAWDGYLEDCDFDGLDDETGAPVPWYGYDATHGDTIPSDWDGVAGSYNAKHEDSLKPPSSGGNTSGNTGGNTSGNTGGNTSGNTGDNTSGSTGGNTSGNTGSNTSGSTGSNTSGSTGGNTGTTGDGTTGTTGASVSTGTAIDKTKSADTTKGGVSAEVTGAELETENAAKESGEKGGVPIALIIIGGIVVLGGVGALVLWKFKVGKKQSV